MQTCPDAFLLKFSLESPYPRNSTRVRPTDRSTEAPSFRDARTHLKTYKISLTENVSLSLGDFSFKDEDAIEGDVDITSTAKGIRARFVVVPKPNQSNAFHVPKLDGYHVIHALKGGS